MQMTLRPSGDCLAQLIDILDSLPLDESRATVASNLMLINQLADVEYFIPMVKKIVADRGALGEIAARSYRHVNYFDKIVLSESTNPNGYRLTLHLWMPPFTDRELKKESLHDHRFSFWSAILVGTLQSENFIEDSNGQVMQHYQYIPEDRAGDSRNLYKFIGDTRLLKASALERRPGESYYQPYFGVHRVILPKSISCTIVLRGPRQKVFTNTFRTDIPKADTQIVNAMFSADVIEKKLIAIVNARE
jgi:hypothetical protein